MPVTDTTVESWKADFRDADTNVPLDSDTMSQLVDDHLRSIKSAIATAFTTHDGKAYEDHALAFTVFSDRLEYSGDHTDVLRVGRRVRVTKSSGTTSQRGWINASTYDGISNKTTVNLLLDTDGSTHTNITAVTYGAIIPYPQKSPIPHYFRCGVVTVTGGSRSGTVTMSPAEWADTYVVLFTNTADTGAGIPPGARLVRLVTTAVDHFDFELDAAPGLGASVTFDWVLVHPQRPNP